MSKHRPPAGQTAGEKRWLASLPPALHKVKDWLLIASLRTKIMGLIIGISLTLGLFATFLIHSVLQENMVVSLQQESLSVSAELSSLASEYILLNDLYGLTRLLRQTAENRKDLRYAFAVNENGQVLAHSFGSEFPSDLLPAPASRQSEVCVPLDTNEGRIWDSYHPYVNGDGGIRVGISESRLRRQSRTVVEKLLLGAMVMALVGIFFTGLIVWLITRPVNNLLAGTLAIRRGDYSVRVQGAPRDEIGRLIEGFNEMSRQLAAAEEERQARERQRQEFMQAIIDAQEQERQRIARELHDQTGQALASLMVGLKLLEQAADQEEIKKNIAGLRDTIGSEIESIHRMVLKLRPSVLDDLGLVAALKRYVCDYIKLHRIDIDLVLVGFDEKRPPPYLETCVYRIVQEALSNVARHAGAGAIKIILEWKLNIIRGVIDDDGSGFDPANRQEQRIGILGMEERVALLGGQFRIESEPGAGTMVAFELPVREV